MSACAMRAADSSMWLSMKCVTGLRHELDAHLGEERWGAVCEQVRIEGVALRGNEQCDRHRDHAELVVAEG